MSCRGVLFAIKQSESQKLRNCKNDNELVEYIEENIEEEWDEDWLCETDKAWDAIHRCFADGKLELFGGKVPLNSVIFGGEILNTEPDYYVSFKNNDLVKEIAKEISLISKEKLWDLYNKITNVLSGPEYFFIYPNGDQVHTVIVLYEAIGVKGELHINDNENKELKYFNVDSLPKLESMMEFISN